ncbi:MAG: hypothetical protein GY941_22090 [Planctomycetes bacterium]|nr:hypothetical protein [Planctomycetota bacterium]
MEPFTLSAIISGTMGAAGGVADLISSNKTARMEEDIAGKRQDLIDRQTSYTKQVNERQFAKDEQNLQRDMTQATQDLETQQQQAQAQRAEGLAGSVMGDRFTTLNKRKKQAQRRGGLLG